MKVAERGAFIVSLDCEGKWGVADHLSSQHDEAFTDARLIDAYDRIVSSLDQRKIPSTFAFTGAFTLSLDAYVEMKFAIDAHAQQLGGWMDGFDRQWHAGLREGWFGRACLDRVKRSGLQEIGLHGFTHVPWTSGTLPRAVYAAEISLAKRAEAASNSNSKTFVFPRNQVGHTDVLGENGFIAYRAARASLGRAMNLLNELNVAAKADSHPSVIATPLCVPAGYFLNWRSGLRKQVPVAVTLRRWRSILEDAAVSNRVAHLWSHPENFITGQGMHELFDSILDMAYEFIKAGRLRAFTQAAYAIERFNEGGFTESQTSQ